jgi:hypothetical protein
MNFILLTSNDCSICEEDEKTFKQVFKDELKSGEAEITNLSEDEEALQFWAEHDLPVTPVVIMTTDTGKVIDILSVEDLVEIQKEQNQAKPTEVAAAAKVV